MTGDDARQALDAALAELVAQQRDHWAEGADELARACTCEEQLIDALHRAGCRASLAAELATEMWALESAWRRRRAEGCS